MYSIEWKVKALKQLRKIPAKSGKAIRDSVDTLADPVTARNVAPLKNHRYDYRMRVGRYRVLFKVRETVQIVTIEEVKKRDDQTY